MPNFMTNLSKVVKERKKIQQLRIKVLNTKKTHDQSQTRGKCSFSSSYTNSIVFSTSILI
jgi:hypothetical protein